MRNTRTFRALGLGLGLLLASAGVASANNGHSGSRGAFSPHMSRMANPNHGHHFGGDRSRGHHFGGDHGNRHFRDRSFFGFDYGYAYPYAYAYGGTCRYFRQKWQQTGSGYWLRRYENCLNRY